ncbi:hypothetical protein L0Y46_02360 [bacterium]|nr:hypothetical protein [bacterium]
MKKFMMPFLIISGIIIAGTYAMEYVQKEGVGEGPQTAAKEEVRWSVMLRRLDQNGHETSRAHHRRVRVHSLTDEGIRFDYYDTKRRGWVSADLSQVDKCTIRKGGKDQGFGGEHPLYGGIIEFPEVSLREGAICLEKKEGAPFRGYAGFPTAGSGVAVYEFYLGAETEDGGEASILDKVMGWGLFGLLLWGLFVKFLL